MKMKTCKNCPKFLLRVKYKTNKSSKWICMNQSLKKICIMENKPQSQREYLKIESSIIQDWKHSKKLERFMK